MPLSSYCPWETRFGFREQNMMIPRDSPRGVDVTRNCVPPKRTKHNVFPTTKKKGQRQTGLLPTPIVHRRNTGRYRGCHLHIFLDLALILLVVPDDTACYPHDTTMLVAEIPLKENMKHKIIYRFTW